MAIEEIFVLESFETYKIWQRRLKLRNKNKEIPEKSHYAMKSFLDGFCKFTRLNPNQLIEEAQKDNDLGHERVADFYSHSRKTMRDNSASTIAYGWVRSFYSRNDVNTSNWIAPAIGVNEVDEIDSQVPLFVRDGNRLELNRKLIKEFLAKLSEKYEIVALCLLSSGLDVNDLLKLKIADIRRYDDNSRIFVQGIRNKTGQTYKTFFSKEATERLRNFLKTERDDAQDDEALFIPSTRELKSIFKQNHGRHFNPDKDILPKIKSVDSKEVNYQFRKVSRKIGLKNIRRHAQSALRPKRFRKVFESACTCGGVPVPVQQTFMGHKGEMTKVYLGKSKEELEYYFELVEPHVTVYSDLTKDNQIRELELSLEKVVKDKQNDFMPLAQEMLERIKKLESRTE